MRKPLSVVLHLPLWAALCLAATLSGCGGTAPVAAPTAAPVKATQPASAWASVQNQVGRRPSDGVDFLRTGPLAQRLRGLMGEINYPVLLENLRGSGPLQQDGNLLFIASPPPQADGAEAAAVILNPAVDGVRVWLLTGGEEWDVQDHGVSIPLPASVRTMMQAIPR
ncbi:hypothetical protein [Acidovorax radicis]|uniref:hypothetical protein n=1 Tax=Acidovorax radicis TaxID=758826 RepID=UPI0002375113|nr:hypothetical protein [Acidovorax radicis]